METVLVAELADHDGWHAPGELAQELGDDELAEQFEEAEEHESEHLSRIRGWLTAAQGRPAPE